MALKRINLNGAEINLPTKVSDLEDDKGFLTGEEASEELDDIETNTYVKYVEQSLTEEQQKQAKKNIGIGEVSSMNYDLNVKAINHRGYSYESPENTIPAYIMSKQKGFTYVEGDVAFTKDNVAVLLHDNTIDRTSNGSGKLSDFNFQELLQFDFGSWFSSKYKDVRIPTFKEWLLLCKNLGLHPYIELKSSSSYTQDQIAQVVNEVAECGMKGKVTYISFSGTYLRYVKDSDASARLGFISSKLSSGDISVAKNLRTTSNEVFIDANLSTLNDSMVPYCVTDNIPLEVWTVNSEKSIINMNSYISGVTSDYIIAGKVLYENSLIYVPPVSNWKPTTSITLDKSIITITSLEPITLVATVEPSDSSEEVVWKSSNDSIATVNNGVVMPIADGDCTITATSGDFSATCTTTVAFTKFNIVSNLTGCQLDSNANNVIVGTSYRGGITPNEGYSLKNASIQITMGGVDITNTAYSNGIITIEKVTGDVTINIVCVAVPVYTINRNLVGCTSNKNITSIGEGNPYNELFTPTEDYRLSGASVIITMGDVDITSMYNNGMLSIPEVTGDIIINITAEKIPLFNISRNLVNCSSDKTVTLVKEGLPYTESFTANEGFTIIKDKTVITMGGIDITSFLSNDGVLNIDSVNGDIEIYIEAGEWENVVTLASDDLKYKAGLTMNNPYYETRNDRVSYVDFDIIVNSGYIYKFDFVSTVETVQFGVQCVKESAKNYINNNQSIPATLRYDPGWQTNGAEIEFPETHNNGMARITFRKDTSNGSVSDGMITSLQVTREKSNK